ncbi:RND transporter [Faecalibacterium sp. An58]|uniref:HlyD family efflux transporter periplasmic adaptor subunit n=1 Tax=Faecalibacterium sp. An58 TaxID=1965648 RepID=UPI000B382F5F|nr:HlyD family efflux transporter periplasmic adaptor subunit [Faecalibacterium sp. An58]OUN75615.1 RND transporter [Faecalibacterium sp. An58]
MTWKKNKGAPAGQQPRADDAAAAESGLNKYKKYLKWIIPLVVVVLLVVVIALRNASTAKTAEVAPEYTQASVTRRTISQTLSTTGTLNAANSYKVKTLVQGEILSSDFEEGDQVSSGQQLYQIENSDASTNVEQAQINLEQAQRNYDQIADYRYVRSPVAGTVYTLSVKVGDEVTSGQEVAVVQDASQMVLQLTFPSADAAHFAVGQSAQITLDGTFEVLQGTVTEVSGSDALSTGNVLVRNVTISTANNGALNTAQSATATINGISSTNSATFNYREQRTLTASTAGTVAKIYISEGGQVPENGIVLELSGDDLEETIQSAYESLRSREISMRNAEDTLANYTITAPINGTVIQKNRQAGESVESGSDLCIIYDMSYLEMTINIDELDINQINVGQPVTVTADSVNGTFDGVVTRVSMVGTTQGGTTTYPVTVQVDEYGDLRPGMNVNADIVVEQASSVIAVPNAAVERGDIVLVTTESPSAANALADTPAPEGYVYVQVETGVSDQNYTEIVSGLQEGDIIGYVSSSTFSYDDYSTSTDEATGSILIAGVVNPVPALGGRK